MDAQSQPVPTSRDDLSRFFAAGFADKIMSMEDWNLYLGLDAALFASACRTLYPGEAADDPTRIGETRRGSLSGRKGVDIQRWIERRGIRHCLTGLAAVAVDASQPEIVESVEPEKSYSRSEVAYHFGFEEREIRSLMWAGKIPGNHQWFRTGNSIGAAAVRELLAILIGSGEKAILSPRVAGRIAESRRRTKRTETAASA